MRKSILIDTGFWIGLADDRDEYHPVALQLNDVLQSNKLLVPWPITYEILRTKNVKHTKYGKQAKFNPYLETIKKVFAGPDVIFIDDAPYREPCLAACLEQRPGDRGFSLVDMILRAIIDAHHHDIGHLITFNPRDFYDICGQKQVGILPEVILARR